MNPVLVYGFPSGSSMGLLAAFEWLGRPYDATRVDMLGARQAPDYLRLNPRRETPALVTEDGRVLTETMAIAGWLEARDDRRRISFEPRAPEADRMHQLMAFLNTGFTAAFGPLWAAWEGAVPEAEKAVLRALGAAQVRERHDRLEEMLADRSTRFAVADHPTLADAVFIGVARWLDVHGLAEPGRWPQVAQLRERLERTPEVIRATALEAGESPAGAGALEAHIPLAALIAKFGR